MDQDKFLKEILANGIEQPSANFTSKVLGKLAAQKATQSSKVEIPSLIVFLAILMPILSLTVSLEPIYAQVSTLLKQLGLSSVINQQTIIVISLGILLFSLLDIFLFKRFAKGEHKNAPKMFSIG
jgi:hypothetical protein